jgi:hypothetical protein
VIDFILVPDGLSGHTVRKELAKARPTSIKVGNFTSLIETLKSLWLLPDITFDWHEVIQRKGIQMPDAFWTKSIKVDEPAVVAQLEHSLNHLLKSLPLNKLLTKLQSPENKAERYFNDLVELYNQIGCARPEIQNIAAAWIEQVDQPAIDSIKLHFKESWFEFDEWQSDVIKALQNLALPESNNQHLIDSVFKQIESNQSAVFHNTAERLFSDLPPITKPESLYGVLCRDAIQECETVASMIQSASSSGTKFDEVVVIYPNGSHYENWLLKVFDKAGIPISNLSSSDTVFDWQTALLRDLIVMQSGSVPNMNWKSVLSNPLMPWRSHAKRISIVEKEFRKAKEIADEIQPGLLDMLAETHESALAILSWLDNIAEKLKPLNDRALTTVRMKEKIEQIGVWFDLYSEDVLAEQIRKILNQLQPKSLKVAGEKKQYLNAVTAVSSNERLLGLYKHGFVVGFNQGNYSYNAAQSASSTVLNLQDWQKLTKITGLGLDSFDRDVEFSQRNFKDQLGKLEESLTILASQQDFEGGRKHLSETALDLALCFSPAESVDASSLFVDMKKPDHPWIKLCEKTIEQVSVVEPSDLGFEIDLLALHKQSGGSQKSESPSSFETMMVSPLAWLLDRQGIRDRVWEVEGLDVRLQGTIAHKVFELYENYQDAHLTESLYEGLFSEAVNIEAPFLLEPQWHLEHIQLKQQVKPAFDKLTAWLKESGWRIEMVEQRLSGKLLGVPVKGFADAILKKDDEVLVLDYKKSKSKDRLTRLSSGFDLQTYIYRELYQQKYGQAPIHSGYYNLNDQVLVLDRVQDQDYGITVLAPELGLVEQSQQARDLVNKRITQLKSGTVELNILGDQANWEQFGIKAYALDNNPIVKRFMKQREEV